MKERQRSSLSQSAGLLLAGFILIESAGSPPAAQARKEFVDTPLTVEEQTELRKAAGYVKSKRFDKSKPMFKVAIDSANDLPKLLAIAAFTEAYGYPLMDVRRACLSKALSLCSTDSDYLQLAIKARQYECFEITRSSIDKLIGLHRTPAELFDLAHKAQEVALNDVAHLAVEKAYTFTKTIPEAQNFVKEAKVLGMEDLLRKCIKDVVDDESNTHELLVWLNDIEPYNIVDLNRYLLKKALDSAATVDDYFDVLKAAKRHGEEDIVSVTMYRGKRKNILDQIKKDQAAYEEKMGQQEQRAQQDLARPSVPPSQSQNPAGF